MTIVNLYTDYTFDHYFDKAKLQYAYDCVWSVLIDNKVDFDIMTLLNTVNELRNSNSRTNHRFVEDLLRIQKSIEYGKQATANWMRDLAVRYALTYTYPPYEVTGTMIASAAIRAIDTVYILPRPARHGTIFGFLSDNGIDVLCSRMDFEQGFLTADGQFVDREVARKLAEYHGQLNERAKDHDDLFSEDVW